MAKAVNWNNVSMLTPGMKNLGNQFNKRWPLRDGASDGAIGDYAHTQSHSGHNPDDTVHDNAEWDGDSDKTPEIRAIDVDNNLNDPTVSMQNVIDHMRKLPNLGSVIRYMIYNEKIYHVNNGFNPAKYDGPSPHKEHAHFSGAWTNASDVNSSFDFKFDQLGDDMPLTDADIDKIWDHKERNPYSGVDQRVGTILSYAPSANPINVVGAKVDALASVVAAIGLKVDLDPVEIQALKDALDVPTAEENANATLQALLGSGVGQLASVLRSALTAEQRAELVTQLSE